MTFESIIYSKLHEETEEIEIAAIRSYREDNTTIRLVQAPYYDPSMEHLNIYGIPFMIFGEVKKDLTSSDNREAISIEELMNNYMDHMTVELHAVRESEVLPTIRIDLGSYNILKTEVLRNYGNLGIFAVKLYLKRKT